MTNPLPERLKFVSILKARVGGNIVPIHAFSLSEHAERFAQLQELVDYSVQFAPIPDGIALIPGSFLDGLFVTTSGSENDLRLVDVRSGRPEVDPSTLYMIGFDPLLDASARGLRLYHVAANIDGRSRVQLCYSERDCRTDSCFGMLLQGFDQYKSVSYNESSIKVHCLAHNRDEAKALSLSLLREPA